MTDYFAVLGLERRPTLPAPSIEGAYYEKTKALHPDRIEGGDLASVNAAFQIVLNPATRIRHLLNLEFGEPGERQIGNELGQLFGVIVEALRGADDELKAISRETSPLLRAVAYGRLESIRNSLERAQERLVERESELHDRISEIDRVWFQQKNQCRKSLAQISVDLTFVQKWLAEVRERKVRLEELF
jgi:curved DNA-binding protein CbpA